MVEAFNKDFIEEVKLTEDGGVVKRIYEHGEEVDPTPV